MDGLVVFCADVGSVKGGNFGWARTSVGSAEPTEHDHASPADLAQSVADELRDGHPVALGFECPLFVPVPTDPLKLGASRPDVIEPEFATVLKSTGRELSTLSPTSRSAWDGRPLALLTRTAPARATESHISIIGHITQTELRRHTTTVEIANGFLNRNADPAGMPTSV